MTLTAVESYGNLFFFCAIMFNFMIVLYQLTFEKEHKLRMGMRMMGLKVSSYTSTTHTFARTWFVA